MDQQAKMLLISDWELSNILFKDLLFVWAVAYNGRDT